MQIVFHCGTHGTDQDGMLKTLMHNRDWLSKSGVEIVSRNRHRGIFENALDSLRGGPATREMEEMMLDAILDSESTDRVICSQPAFMGMAARAVSPDGLFPVAPAKLAALANLFPSAEVEFFIGLKNPATLIPFCIEQSGESIETLLGTSSPHHLRWGPAIRRIRKALDGRRLVMWCHEDTPLIWPEIVRMIARMPGDVPLKAGLHILGEILEPDGIRFIRDEMEKQERVTISRRREIFSHALQQFARSEVIESTITLPGWTQELVDRMSADYDEDVAEIASLPGVEFISP